MLERYWDRDTWLKQRKASWAMAVFGILFLSMIMSCQELRYMVSGKVVDAGGSSREETYVDHGNRITHRVLTYNYTDGNESRGQTIEVPRNWDNIHNGTVKIQYIPGRDTSRILGQTNKIWVFIFFGSLVLSIIAGIALAKWG